MSTQNLSVEVVIMSMSGAHSRHNLLVHIHRPVRNEMPPQILPQPLLLPCPIHVHRPCSTNQLIWGPKHKLSAARPNCDLTATARMVLPSHFCDYCDYCRCPTPEPTVYKPPTDCCWPGATRHCRSFRSGGLTSSCDTYADHDANLRDNYTNSPKMYTKKGLLQWKSIKTVTFH